eukprot:TRINITY_DN74142_c0_g1_i1.p1 TRINITY_DN74142_c0_g1~~TRINITY_DN74142_c0_g1_i1.p1  ORF type:complete len:1346 (-),score=230.61 TRINITY_DN74142_c0_g1_i1:293-4273(-)
MAASRGDSSVLAFTLEFHDERPSRRFELLPGQVVRIGRSPKSDVMVDNGGVSWQHAELKVIMPQRDGQAEPELCILDLSSNGSGLQRPGGSPIRALSRGVATPVPDGGVLAVPLKVKPKIGVEEEKLRLTFVVRIHDEEPADSKQGRHARDSVLQAKNTLEQTEEPSQQQSGSKGAVSTTRTSPPPGRDTASTSSSRKRNLLQDGKADVGLAEKRGKTGREQAQKRTPSMTDRSQSPEKKKKKRKNATVQAAKEEMASEIFTGRPGPLTATKDPPPRSRSSSVQGKRSVKRRRAQRSRSVSVKDQKRKKSRKATARHSQFASGDKKSLARDVSAGRPHSKKSVRSHSRGREGRVGLQAGRRSTQGSESRRSRERGRKKTEDGRSHKTRQRRSAEHAEVGTSGSKRTSKRTASWSPRSKVSRSCSPVRGALKSPHRDQIVSTAAKAKRRSSKVTGNDNLKASQKWSPARKPLESSLPARKCSGSRSRKASRSKKQSARSNDRKRRKSTKKRSISRASFRSRSFRRISQPSRRSDAASSIPELEQFKKSASKSCSVELDQRRVRDDEATARVCKSTGKSSSLSQQTEAMRKQQDQLRSTSRSRSRVREGCTASLQLAPVGDAVEDIVTGGLKAEPAADVAPTTPGSQDAEIAEETFNTRQSDLSRSGDCRRASESPPRKRSPSLPVDQSNVVPADGTVAEEGSPATVLDHKGVGLIHESNSVENDASEAKDDGCSRALADDVSESNGGTCNTECVRTPLAVTAPPSPSATAQQHAEKHVLEEEEESTKETPNSATAALKNIKEVSIGGNPATNEPVADTVVAPVPVEPVTEVSIDLSEVREDGKADERHSEVEADGRDRSSGKALSIGGAGQSPGGSTVHTFPSWVKVGQKVRWWSESLKKHCPIVVTKISERQRVVIATFEENKSVWKSVPFSMLGRSDCPLRPPKNQQADGIGGTTSVASRGSGGGGAAGTASVASTAGGKGSEGQAAAKVGDVAQEAKKKREPSRSATPPWWEMKTLDKAEAERIRLLEEERQRKEDEERRREERRVAEEVRRRELLESERRKVEEAFEMRKKEAEERRLREEEEWRRQLREQREREAAEEAEREERRKKRHEERAQRKGLDGRKREAEAEEERKRAADEERERKRVQAEAAFEQTCRANNEARRKERAEVPTMMESQSSGQWVESWSAGLASHYVNTPWQGFGKGGGVARPSLASPGAEAWARSLSHGPAARPNSVESGVIGQSAASVAAPGWHGGAAAYAFAGAGPNGPRPFVARPAHSTGAAEYAGHAALASGGAWSGIYDANGSRPKAGGCMQAGNIRPGW